MKMLCATDLLPKSERAITRAGLLADQLAADLTLLHVVGPGASERAVESTLQAARAQIQSRARSSASRSERAANVEVRAGDPARVISNTIKQSKAQLLVMGAHRKRAVRDVFERTLAEKVLAKRLCPVLIVRDEAQGSYRRALLALDLSDASASAIRATESLGLVREAEASVVYAYEPPYHSALHYAGAEVDLAQQYPSGWRRAASCGIQDLLRYESAESAKYDIQVEAQPGAVGILQAVERHKPDLIVMGTYGGGRVRRALVGSVAHRVVQETHCDALIVPEGSFGALRSRLLFGVRCPVGVPERSVA